MAMIGRIVVIAIAVIACFYVFAAFSAHAISEGEWEDVQQFDTFNKTASYADFMQNQSNQMRKGLKAQSSSTNNQNSLDLIVNILFNGVSTTVMSFFTFVDVLFAIIFDLGIVLAIPAIFIGLIVILFTYQVIAGVIRGIRIGEI